MTKTLFHFNGDDFKTLRKAQWAVFMDSLGVEYQCFTERPPERGPQSYRPDFYLPHQDCWIVVSPHKLSIFYAFGLFRLAQETGKFVFLLNEVTPFFQNKRGRLIGNQRYISPNGEPDSLMEWGVCPACGNAIIGHFGSHDVSYTEFDKKTCDYRGDGFVKSPRLAKAYKAAEDLFGITEV